MKINNSIRLCNRENSKSKGFSLIELMIVIGIIAILSVAILPSVTGAKEKATQARYLSDCKTIISAVEIYNLNVTNSTDSISDTTTLEQVKSKIVDGLTVGERYLKSWPVKLPSELNSYQDLVDYVEGP